MLKNRKLSEIKEILLENGVFLGSGPRISYVEFARKICYCIKGTEGRKMIPLHHSHPTNGVGPSNSNGGLVSHWIFGGVEMNIYIT